MIIVENVVKGYPKLAVAFEVEGGLSVVDVSKKGTVKCLLYVDPGRLIDQFKWLIISISTNINASKGLRRLNKGHQWDSPTDLLQDIINSIDNGI